MCCRILMGGRADANIANDVVHIDTLIHVKDIETLCVVGNFIYSFYFLFVDHFSAFKYVSRMLNNSIRINITKDLIIYHFLLTGLVSIYACALYV